MLFIIMILNINIIQSIISKFENNPSSNQYMYTWHVWMNSWWWHCENTSRTYSHFARTPVGKLRRLHSATKHHHNTSWFKDIKTLIDEEKWSWEKASKGFVHRWLDLMESIFKYVLIVQILCGFAVLQTNSRNRCVSLWVHS